MALNCLPVLSSALNGSLSQCFRGSQLLPLALNWLPVLPRLSFTPTGAQLSPNAPDALNYSQWRPLAPKASNPSIVVWSHSPFPLWSQSHSGPSPIVQSHSPEPFNVFKCISPSWGSKSSKKCLKIPTALDKTRANRIAEPNVSHDDKRCQVPNNNLRDQTPQIPIFIIVINSLIRLPKLIAIRQIRFKTGTMTIFSLYFIWE